MWVLVSMFTLLWFSPVWAADEQIVFTQSANGSRTTRPFTVKDRWEVQWKSDKDLTLFLMDTKGQPIDSLGNSTQAGTGSTYRAEGGIYSLKIISNASWTITVVQLP